MLVAPPDQSKPNITEWQQQEILTESEVTLVKFDSDLSENGEQPTLNHLLQKYSIEERVNFVINRDKGEVIDINGKIIETFKRFPSAKNSKNSIGASSPSDKPEIDSIKEQSKRTCMTPPRTRVNSDYVKIESTPKNVWDDYWQQSDKIHKKLLMSICQKNSKVFSQLFNKKLNHVPININYKSFDNWTPIHFAALHGNTFALEHLLGMPQIYVNSLTNFKLSALHVATKNNKIDTVSLLLKANIEINYQDEDGNTALHYAAELGHKDIVTLLLANPNTNLELRNNKGFLAKEMSTSSDVIKIFNSMDKAKTEQTSHNGFLTALRNNRHVEKLLMKVNQNYNKVINQKEEESEKTLSSPTKKRETQGSQSGSGKKVPEGKRENIVRMYQLLKEKKNNEKVGLDSFKFYKKIGEGAFGEVYIVKKGKSDKLYALKAIKKQKILGNSIMRYIQTEKEVLSLIKHPFIVKLHFAFQTEAYLFLVMDYCEGGDLGKYLERSKNFDEKSVKYYAAEILLALEALHKEKIIYRDLKPDNIVLDHDGHVLLTDFGLSKKTTSIDDINKSFCGTPAYLPLEIINKKGHNRMADWYEYGVVLYELYTGIPPFYAETRAQLYQNVRTGIIKFPRGTPEQFRDIIKKLLSQNPEKRLGYIEDAESIKQHPWFCGIDWDDVYNRRLAMPKIVSKAIIGDPIKTKFIEQRNEKNLVSDWSFIAS